MELVWKDATDRANCPDSDRDVICVKQRKDGTKSLAIGRYCKEFDFNGGWCVSGSVKVVYWMELPKLPD